MTLVLTSALEQQAVGNWPGRLLGLAIMLALIALALWAMRRGWRNRQARQAGIPAPDERPGGAAGWTASAAGTYLGTSRAGDWLDRIAVHELGVPSQATCHIGPDGAWLERQGARSAWIPRPAIEELRVDRGVAGTVRDKDSVLIVRWSLGEAVVESGFRASAAEGQRGLLDAARSLHLPLRTEASA